MGIWRVFNRGVGTILMQNVGIRADQVCRIGETKIFKGLELKNFISGDVMEFERL